MEMQRINNKILLTDKENGRKWEITSREDGDFWVQYFEFFKDIGWHSYTKGERYSREAVQFEFDLNV